MTAPLYRTYHKRLLALPLSQCEARHMPSRGRHQSTSKECRVLIRRIEAMDGVLGVIIGYSYGGKSLARSSRTGAIRIQRTVSGGLKAVTQSAKGLQELFIRTEAGKESEIAAGVQELE